MTSFPGLLVIQGIELGDLNGGAPFPRFPDSAEAGLHSAAPDLNDTSSGHARYSVGHMRALSARQLEKLPVHQRIFIA